MSPAEERLPALPAAETLLLVVHLTVVGGFARLFSGHSFLLPLVVTVVGSQATAILCRRSRMPPLFTAATALLTTALLVTWTLFGETTRFGLPGPATTEAVGAALETAKHEFGRVIAPTDAIPGFLLLASLTLSAAVWFSDWAAFRLRTTPEAISPPTVLFLFCTILGSGRFRLASAGAFIAAVLAFVVVHRSMRSQVDRAWLEDRPSAGSGALLRNGLGVAAVAVLGAVLLAPVLPGADADPLVRWRRQEPAAANRTTVSPIVTLQPRLVDQADTPLFQVRAERPAYWRLTGLDDFDGTIWRIDSTFTSARGALPSSSTPDRDVPVLAQEFTIQEMDDLWVPAAFEASAILSSSHDLRWDARSSTLIVDRDLEGTAGLRYTVASVVADHSPEQLRSATGPDPAGFERFTEVPPGLPAEVGDLARDLTAEAPDRYRAMLELQRFFRDGFEYSTEVPEGHDGPAILAFLERRSGYCEQFAGTYAAMARTLGIPARVAVGFTPGEPVPGEPDLLQVRGRHAHAWPEVHFPGVGWVPFEPTPGRGMPGADAYTGVAPQQDPTPGPADEPVEPATTTTAAASEDPEAPATTEPSAGIAPDPEMPIETDSGRDRSDPFPSVPVVLAAVIVLGAGALAARRSRRGARSTDPVISAWDEVARRLHLDLGVVREPGETIPGFALRVERHHEDLLPAGRLHELALIVDAVTWDRRAPSGQDVDRARRAAGAITVALAGRRRRRGAGRARRSDPVSSASRGG